MKILTEKRSAFKRFIVDFIIPMLPLVMVGIIGIIALPALRWIAERLP